MADGPVAKKIRIWNPAVSEHTNSSNEPETQDDKPLDCSSKVSQIQVPELFQNYLHLAPLMMRMQQQRHIEEFARRQFFNQFQLAQQPRILPIPIPPTMTPIQLPSVSEPTPTASAPPPPTPINIITNPIVANALGSPLINENCCAVCGAAFRLTGDLVQHMRNNHRKSKFKRKSDLRQ